MRFAGRRAFDASCAACVRTLNGLGVHVVPLIGVPKADWMSPLCGDMKFSGEARNGFGFPLKEALSPVVPFKLNGFETWLCSVVGYKFIN